MNMTAQCSLADMAIMRCMASCDCSMSLKSGMVSAIPSTNTAVGLCSCDTLSTKLRRSDTSISLSEYALTLPPMSLHPSHNVMMRLRIFHVFALFCSVSKNRTEDVSLLAAFVDANPEPRMADANTVARNVLPFLLLALMAMMSPLGHVPVPSMKNV